MTEYLNMWRNFANFSYRTTLRGYWMAVLVHFFVGLLVGWFLPNSLRAVYSVAIFLPTLSIVIRRFRDAGKSWLNIFWTLLPVFGWIIEIVLLCQPSIPDDGVPVV